MKASDILSYNDLRVGEVEVEEWGCTLHIRELGLEEGLKLFSMAQDVDENPTLDANDVAQVVAWGVIDPETGGRLFSDDDVPALAKKSHKPLMKLYAAIAALSAEDAEKN